MTEITPPNGAQTYAAARTFRWLVGWIGFRLMVFGEWAEILGDDLVEWSEADRGE